MPIKVEAKDVDEASSGGGGFDRVRELGHHRHSEQEGDHEGRPDSAGEELSKQDEAKHEPARCMKLFSPG